MPGHSSGRCTSASTAVGVGAERARRVVERRVDPAHARVDREERERLEAHDVRHDQPEDRAREQQPEVDAEQPRPPSTIRRSSHASGV